MPKVSVIVVLWNSKKFIQPVFQALSRLTYPELEIIAVINADDGSKALLENNFPKVRIIDPGRNLGFAGGNNLAIKQSTGEFIQLVNPDLIVEPDYVERMLEVFSDQNVAAATGKLLRYDFERNVKTNIIDSTGVVISPSGRAKDRGQLQEDNGQFDAHHDVFGVSGAGPMYRRSALEKAKYCENGSCEYFDESFGSYWEDVDLSWRLNNLGFKNVYVPAAVAYHGRSAGQSKGGYLHVLHFISHHRKLSPLVRKLNYKNHILMYLKNAKFIHPMFVLREIFMFVYVVVFETSTLKVLPELFRQTPGILRKRSAIKSAMIKQNV